MTTPWYSEGLRFACSKCGKCCTGAPGYVWVGRDEIERLAEHVELSVEEFGKRYLRRVGRKLSLVEKPNFDCVFWNGGCTVYAARPLQCRTFPFWPENIDSREAWDETAAECPGIGKGRFYPVDAIERISRGDGEASRASRR